MQTNINRWRNYFKGVGSPDSFITWSFYSMIACALQRRVWCGDLKHEPLFPNLYVILTAPPGVGKDRVIKPVRRILEYHTKSGRGDPIRQKGEFDPSLIQVGSSSTTYQALIVALSKATDAVSLKMLPKFEGEKCKDHYIHASLAVVLTEMGSMFRQHMEDLVTFLLETYDCGNYTYECIGRGKDKIHNCCVNILGGTNPNFLRRVFNDDLLNEGFASRSIFVYEQNPRFRTTKAATRDEQQEKDYEHILEWIKHIATDILGEVKFTDEATDYMELWWKNLDVVVVNKSPKLEYYYSRKNITVKKLAMVLHYSELSNNEIGVEEVKKAIQELGLIEKNMHGAVSNDAKNPLAGVGDNILKYIRQHGPKTQIELFVEFYGELPEQENSLRTVLDNMMKMNKIKLESGKYKALI